MLKGLLGFKRVGFQSNKDTRRFIGQVEKQLGPRLVRVRSATPEGQADLVFHVQLLGQATKWTCNVGTFPISVKTDRIVEMAASLEEEEVQAIRKNIMMGRQGKLFLSVERFDYTKGGCEILYVEMVLLLL